MCTYTQHKHDLSCFPCCLGLIFSLTLVILTSHLIFLPMSATKCFHRQFKCLFCSLEPSALPHGEFSSDHLTGSPTLNKSWNAENFSLWLSFYSILKCLLSIVRHLTIFLQYFPHWKIISEISVAVRKDSMSQIEFKKFFLANKYLWF